MGERWLSYASTKRGPQGRTAPEGRDPALYLVQHRPVNAGADEDRVRARFPMVEVILIRAIHCDKIEGVLDP